MTERASNWQPAAADFRRKLPFGALAFLGAFGSLVSCYGSIFVATFAGSEGWAPNPHLQAVTMWSFGLLAIFALWRDRRNHSSILPILIGIIGVFILLFALYVRYDMRFEILAYVCLVVAALLNQNMMIGRLYQTIRNQAEQIEEFNLNLEKKVENQVGEIERLNRLKSFLAPQVAELVMAENREKLLESHRQYIACLFCDIRNFTALSETAEPEEIISLLQAYHERVGQLVSRQGGTIGFRAGDGLMVFFNDPIPRDQPVSDAIRLAIAIRAASDDLCAHWTKLGYPVGVGIGLASGYATLGLVGHEGGATYTAIGNVVNIASRLCEQAENGELLIDQRAYLDVERQIRAESRGSLTLKGLGKAVEAYTILDFRDDDAVAESGHADRHSRANSSRNRM